MSWEKNVGMVFLLLFIVIYIWAVSAVQDILPMSGLLYLPAVLLIILWFFMLL